MDENLMIIISRHKHAMGTPCAGTTSDIWSFQSCRDSFGCLRGSFSFDGDMLAQVSGLKQLAGKVVDAAPVLAFRRFEEKRHSGKNLADWKKTELTCWGLADAIGLATEDGASNNKTANRILGQDQQVCWDHEIARAVLHACGETGDGTKNSQLKAYIKKASSQAAAFSRSVVANKELQEAQLEVNPDLKEHQVLSTKTKNLTRWTGLYEMSNRNRRLQPFICKALTGDEQGECEEEPAPVMPHEQDNNSDEEEEDAGSDGEQQETANADADKEHPLAHRCLSMCDFKHGELLESVLDRPKEVTLLVQDQKEGWGEGLDIGLSWMSTLEMRDEARHDRLEVVSGRGAAEAWKEINASSLPAMIKTFRTIFSAQLTTRFNLDTTPSKHIQLALKMNPSLNTSMDGPLLIGKLAFAELMEAEYRRVLKRQAVLQARVGPSLIFNLNATAPADTPAPAPTPAAAPTVAHPHPPMAAPALKRRRSLLGAVAVKQSANVEAQGEGESLLDLKVSAEIEKFEQLRCKILAKGLASEYFYGTNRFNLHVFWGDHKTILPIHYAAFLAEVGCKKAAAANVESSFSGAGKFSAEAKSVGGVLLTRMVKLHENWKYPFLRPTVETIIKRYESKFGGANAADAGEAPTPAPAATATATA